MPSQLRMEMRIGETRPISIFTLREGENLSTRVKEELEVAAREGDLGDHSATPSAPFIRVFEVDEKGQKLDGAIHLFSLTGADVTSRETSISIEEDDDGKAILLEGIVQDEKGGETTHRIGVFFDEELARRIAAIWKTGALD